MWHGIRLHLIYGRAAEKDGGQIMAHGDLVQMHCSLYVRGGLSDGAIAVKVTLWLGEKQASLNSL